MRMAYRRLSVIWRLKSQGRFFAGR